MFIRQSAGLLFALFALVAVAGCGAGPDEEAAQHDAEAVPPDLRYLREEVDRLAARGAAPEDRAAALSSLGEALDLAGDAAGEVAARREALEFVRLAYGDGDLRTAAAETDLARTLLRWRSGLEEAEQLARSAYAKCQAGGIDDLAMADSQAVLSAALSARGHNGEALAHIETALARHRQLLGPEDPALAAVLVQAASIHTAADRSSPALDRIGEATALYRMGEGESPLALADALFVLAETHRHFGRFVDAEDPSREALALREAGLGRDHPDTARSLFQLASTLRNQGRFAEAEPLIRQALTQQEGALGPEHLDVAHSLHELGRLYYSTSRIEESLSVFARARSIAETAGAPSRFRLTIEANIGHTYRLADRDDEALDIFDQLLQTLREDPALGEANTLFLGHVLMARGAALRELRRINESEAALKESIALLEPLGNNAARRLADAWFGLGLTQLFLAQHEEDGSDEKEKVYRAAIASFHQAEKYFEATRGPHATQLVQLRAILGWTAVRLGDDDLAFENALTALASLEQRLEAATPLDRLRPLDDRRMLLADIEAIVSSFADISQSHADRREEAIAVAFRAAQFAKGSATAVSAREAALIAEAAGPEIALMRERRDLIDAKQTLERRYAQLLGQDAQTGRDLLAEASALQGDIDRLTARLQAEAPHIFDLIAPQAVPVERLNGPGGLLRPNEALLVAFLSEHDAIPILITPSGTFIGDTFIKQDAVAQMVDELRASVDISDVVFASDLPDFAVATSGELHQILIAPFEAQLADVDTLHVVPHGPLGRLPFSLLAGAPDAEGGAPDWLIDHVAVSHVPSVSTFVALRRERGEPEGGARFLGVGDPLLPGETRQADLVTFAGLRSAAREAGLTGSAIDAAAVCRLSALPDTRRELEAMGAMFGAGGSDFLLGADASEPALQALNETGELAAYDVIAFATHGLLAGGARPDAEVEPALVLTPPAGCTASDASHDGLLTAGEIAGLKLAADWILLSACSTAAGDPAAGAEPLSGLGKAFFHAGARSLLVSHWDIESEATSDFMAMMFDEAAGGISRAEALRRTQLAFRDTPAPDHQHYAHPAFWAPFALIGETG